MGADGVSDAMNPGTRILSLSMYVCKDSGGTSTRVTRAHRPAAPRQSSGMLQTSYNPTACPISVFYFALSWQPLPGVRANFVSARRQSCLRMWKRKTSGSGEWGRFTRKKAAGVHGVLKSSRSLLVARERVAC